MRRWTTRSPAACRSSLEGAVDGQDTARTVTRAEASGMHDTVRRLPLRACAMFLRLLAAEAAAETARPT